MKKETFSVKGMHCASCVGLIERRIKKLPGVAGVNVNLATNKATIEFEEEKVDVKQFNSAVQAAGYSLESQTRELPGTLKLHVMGMDSLHCAGIVESALKKSKGVKSTQLNFATQTAVVNYDPALTDFAQLRKSVFDAGYDAELLEEEPEDRERTAREKEMKDLWIRVVGSALLTVPVTLLALSEMLSGIFVIEYPAFIVSNMALLQFLLSTPVLWLNRDFFERGFRGLLNRTPGMDSLVALGVGT
ncbi:MAG: copper ion binding protein, partial [Candidatus Diapherotrites archaeon]|nr:copper ion binding protein [Candidatus Diapherotrites archaeon]